MVCVCVLRGGVICKGGLGGDVGVCVGAEQGFVGSSACPWVPPVPQTARVVSTTHSSLGQGISQKPSPHPLLPPAPPNPFPPHTRNPTQTPSHKTSLPRESSLDEVRVQPGPSHATGHGQSRACFAEQGQAGGVASVQPAGSCQHALQAHLPSKLHAWGGEGGCVDRGRREAALEPCRRPALVQSRSAARPAARSSNADRQHNAPCITSSIANDRMAGEFCAAPPSSQPASSRCSVCGRLCVCVF